MPTYEEWQENHIKEQQKIAEEQRKELDKASSDSIEGGPFGPEDADAQAERVAAVRSTMIFGDTDTTAGAGAVNTDVPSHDNEGASVAAAEADSKGHDVSHDKARRQVDVDAGTTESAQTVEEGAVDRGPVDKVEIVDPKDTDSKGVTADRTKRAPRVKGDDK